VFIVVVSRPGGMTATATLGAGSPPPADTELKGALTLFRRLWGIMMRDPMADQNEIAAPQRLALDSLVGDSASTDALARLKQAAERRSRSGATLSSKAQAKQRKALTLLKSGLQALAAQDYAAASVTILSVLELDERMPLAWHMLAISLEKQGQLAKAFSAYEAAVQLAPDDVAVASDLGRLAHRLGELEIAAKLLQRFLSRNPGEEEATNNLACVLRDQNRYGEAIDLLRGMLGVYPERPVLWNTLGTVLSESGDMAGSMVFFDEALRLDPAFYKARYNRANCLVSLGQPEQALRDMEVALEGVTDPLELATIGMAKALTQLLIGDLANGFETYEARLDAAHEAAVHFDPFGRRWTPDDDLSGRSLLVYGEQGLGDEVLFANPLRDVLDAIGPDGRLFIAVEYRLVSLFQRSFPEATVVAHKSASHMGAFYRTADLPETRPDIDFWTPMASLFRRFRTRREAFPREAGYLTPDPERVAHWREVLKAAGPGPSVGVLWKSMKMGGSRERGYSPFALWGPILSTPGVRFVNLQYGDATEDLAAAKAQGYDIWTPPGIDLKLDLDDLTALCVALDGVMGPSTATTNLAAAAGARVWLSAGPGSWTRFGSDNYPCYPSARVFHAEHFGQWEPVIQQMADALSQELLPAAADRKIAV
jgi:tetratricopeptide (TPR) repeat protein